MQRERKIDIINKKVISVETIQRKKKKEGRLQALKLITQVNRPEYLSL